MSPTITISSKRTASVHFRHPWIFSGAVVDDGGAQHGDVVRAVDEEGTCYGVGTYSAHSSIAVRMLSWKDETIDAAWFVRRMREADARRALMGLGLATDTTGYRVLFGESDGVPGLIVDRYGNVVVFQLATAGLDCLRAQIVEALEQTLAPTAIVERSDAGVRKDDGLDDIVAVHRGTIDAPAPFLERGRAYVADVLAGQKTGFFLDQRDARDAVARLASGRACLNLFSYTGAFGVAAMVGDAARVHNVDLSASALALCREHARLNHIDESRFTTEEADVFQWLGTHEQPAYDLVVLDPPALIKSSKDADAGKKAYHFLNRAAMRLLRDGGIFVTSSCSAHLSEEDLAFTLRRASVQAGVHLDVLLSLRQAPDHPVSLYFPESAYLKTFVCKISKMLH